MTTCRRQGSRTGPGQRLVYLALILCCLSDTILIIVTGLILNHQSALSEYNAIGDWLELPLLERDEATNNYRRSFNALFVVLQAGLILEAYIAVRSRSTLHFYMLSAFHLYSNVHAFQEQSLWRFMVNIYQDEIKHNSSAWLATAVVGGTITATVIWAFFSTVFHRLWGWRRLRRCGEERRIRRMFILHYVYSKLLIISPLMFLGYVNRLLIQLPTANGDEGLRMDFLRLFITLGALTAIISVPGCIGLHRESKILSWVSVINMGLLLVVSTVYYIMGLRRELVESPLNPWGDVELHSVTIFFFVLGTLLLPGMIVLGVLNMHYYNQGLKELRTSQTLLDNQEDFDDAPTDLNLNGVNDSVEPYKDSQMVSEPQQLYTVHRYPPSSINHNTSF